ncbi:energy transducer TonB family protein [Methylobacterium iners]|uniref:TonB C-terminal domain-containing protein n=1 Tax=Methylobacterium iners TaxID=418707 RepID=A0ABQ4S109_9HYPH|nr:energy transducer TonB [Methylobacterium iners]GJD96127.1 hypothetical protein OCOJLMKI_3345 [Methylobacterium iners]
MGLRSFIWSAGLCAVLLASSEVWAQDQTPPDVREWLSTVVTKITKAGGKETNPSRGRASRPVTIRVQIAADGFVNRVVVEKSSGSPELDERARSVVRAAGPFRPPPAPLLTEAGSTELSFPLRLGR